LAQNPDIFCGVALLLQLTLVTAWAHEDATPGHQHDAGPDVEADAAIAARAPTVPPGPPQHSMAAQELWLLDDYLRALSAGQRGIPSIVDQLVDTEYPALHRVMTAYAALAADAPDASERAFLALLERLSRGARLPWPLLCLYDTPPADGLADGFAAFLTGPPETNELERQLFARLMRSPLPRDPYDLSVRLTPAASLRALAEPEAGPEQRLQLLEAWNRWLHARSESRPFHARETLVARVAARFDPADAAPLVEAQLMFVGAWPELRASYEQDLRTCLQADDPALVATGLTVQRHYPALLLLNEEILNRFTDHAQVREQALENFAFDTGKDHSASLRRIWSTLDAAAPATRYHCLFAMGVHPQGNVAAAAAAVHQDPAAFIGVSLPILEHAGAKSPVVREVIAHVLGEARGGHEEALRLALALDLPDFQDDARRILSTSKEQVVQLAALQYLRLAPGSVRREWLAWLRNKNDDLRLAAIQMYGSPRGLTAADRDAIGPELIRVALHDTSMGHRQEAMFSVSAWAAKDAASFFNQVLKENPPLTPRAGYDATEADYWRHRLRLMGLLGLARLGERSARAELDELHRHGGTVERMNVLLAWRELAEVPGYAFEDLAAAEPKLVATAAQLLRRHGTPEQVARLEAWFAGRPAWRLFEGSGIDDHLIPYYAGFGARSDQGEPR